MSIDETERQNEEEIVADAAAKADAWMDRLGIKRRPVKPETEKAVNVSPVKIQGADAPKRRILDIADYRPALPQYLDITLVASLVLLLGFVVLTIGIWTTTFPVSVRWLLTGGEVMIIGLSLVYLIVLRHTSRKTKGH